MIGELVLCHRARQEITLGESFFFLCVIVWSAITYENSGVATFGVITQDLWCNEAPAIT